MELLKISQKEKNYKFLVKEKNWKKNLGSITDLTRLPAALFVVDVMKEQIAVREMIVCGIPVLLLLTQFNQTIMIMLSY